MPKYKLRNFYKTLLQIWLFYYFLNSIKVHKCQQLDDVEFIDNTRHDENDVSDLHTKFSDSELAYEPIDTNNKIEYGYDETDDTKNVNLNVENEVTSHGDVSHYTEILEDRISGEKILYTSESPYLLRQDLEVQQSARLTIEPGVTIHFAPLVGITIYGSIKAIVSSIKITKLVIRMSIEHALNSLHSYLISAKTCEHNKCISLIIISIAVVVFFFYSQHKYLLRTLHNTSC